MKNKTDIKDITNVNFLIRDLKADNYNQSIINSLENILADRERLEKENKQLKIDELNSLSEECSKLAKEANWTKEDTNRVITEYRELESKANKYDSLVEKIKEKKEKLRKEALEIHSILIKQTKKEYDYMLYKRYLDVIQQVKVLQELLDTEKEEI